MVHPVTNAPYVKTSKRIIVYYGPCQLHLSRIVPGTVSEGLNGWSEALTAGLAV